MSEQVVIGVSRELQEISGFSFVFNRGTNEYKRRPDLRTRLFSLGQADFIVNKLPREVALESLEYRIVHPNFHSLIILQISHGEYTLFSANPYFQ